MNLTWIKIWMARFHIWGEYLLQFWEHCQKLSLRKHLFMAKFYWLWHLKYAVKHHFVGFSIFVCNVCQPDFSLSFWRWKRCRSGQATEFRTVHTSVCTRSCPRWRHPRPVRKPAPLCIAPALGVLQSLPVPHCTGRSRYPLKKNVWFEMQYEYGLSYSLCCVHCIDGFCFACLHRFIWTDISMAWK